MKKIEIKFCLTEDIDEMKMASVSELDNDFPFAGYFQLNVGEKSFGHWNNGWGSELYGPDLVSFWFTRLINVVIHLIENDNVSILLFNLYSNWIGFELENGLLRVSSVHMDAENVEMENFITPMGNKQYEIEWKANAIPLNDVIEEVISQAKEYLIVLEKINPLFKETEGFNYLKNQIYIAESKFV